MAEGTLTCLPQGCRRDLPSLPLQSSAGTQGTGTLPRQRAQGHPQAVNFHSLSVCVPELMGRAGAQTYSGHSEERKGAQGQKADMETC